MTKKLNLEEIKKHLYLDYDFYYVKKVELNSCNRCNGTGFISEETLSDYHRREYFTTRKECRYCSGDGRVVVTTHEIEPTPTYKNELVEVVPYSQFDGDPFTGNESIPIRLRLDRRDSHMETQHEELEKISYEKYDQLLDELLTREALEKEPK